MPPQQWYGRTKGKGRRLIRDKEGALFPIRVGASLKFRATVTTDKPPFGWEHDWECRVTDEETLETLGGPFETFVVKCGHDGVDQITYHYSPKVGNYLAQRTKSLDGRPDSVRNLLSFERADGTVVAGIVVDRRAQSPKRTAAATPAVPKKLPETKLANKVPLRPKVEIQQARATARAVNPKQGSRAETTVSDAIASLGLTEPKFGGRAAAPTAVVESARKSEAGATSPRTRTLKPAPAPVPAAKPKTTAPAPKRAQPVKRVSRAPSAPTLGPRAASPAVKFAPRARVPVPPPPLVAKKTAPSAPAAPKSRVPPPPIAVKAPPAVPKAPVIAPAIPSPPRAPPVDSVHLASYRSAAAAKQGWTALTNKNDDVLGALKPEIRKVEVAGKGTYYRLYAGPVASSSVAGLCRKLNSRGVFCSPAS